MKTSFDLNIAVDKPSECLSAQKAINRQLNDDEIIQQCLWLYRLADAAIAYRALALHACHDDRPHLVSRIAKLRGLSKKAIQESLLFSDALIEDELTENLGKSEDFPAIDSLQRVQ
jgi:hypothetical protein